MSKKQAFRVVLVDDDPAMLHLLEEILVQRFPEEVRIKTLCDPVEARRCLDTELVDLLITDIEMPGISGLELLRIAKHNNAWTQALVVTGHSNVYSLVDALEMGANDYLIKPVNPRDLEEVVTYILRRFCRWQEALAGSIASPRKEPIREYSTTNTARR
jgi:DNA-binding response OmpR family regulator